jgi:hypothetical protein
MTPLLLLLPAHLQSMVRIVMLLLLPVLLLLIIILVLILVLIFICIIIPAIFIITCRRIPALPSCRNATHTPAR